MWVVSATTWRRSHSRICGRVGNADVGVRRFDKERKDWTMAEESKLIEVSRRIEATPARIFEIVANPHRHQDFDGSGMLRGLSSTPNLQRG